MSIPYELSFTGEPAARGKMDVRLTSTSLDERMHPTGSVKILFARGAAQAKGDSTYTLESFQFDSLAGYLQDQSKVRAALEQALAADRREHAGADDLAGP